MAEITYLLGAGASCNALPVVNDMYDKIQQAIKWFELVHHQIHPRFSQHGQILVSKETEKEDGELKRIIADLQWLKEICNTSKNFSVDTFARKLDLSGRNEDYIKLKNILSFYFTLEQRRNLPDVRYDNFWASILKSRDRFPNNVKIISWNYDFQLELTYDGFSEYNSLKRAREILNILGQESELINSGNTNKFGIFKLNGSATFNIYKTYDRDTSYIIDNFKSSNIDNFITKLVETYENMCKEPNTYKNHLSFAWEHKTDNPFYQRLKESIQNTEVLVVIGYSFPFFNRDIDKLIINDFMSKEKLKKVYFQAPDAEDLRERFLAINDKVPIENLLLRKDIKQFTLPNEL